jgi:hypothetical protein
VDAATEVTVIIARGEQTVSFRKSVVPKSDFGTTSNALNVYVVVCVRIVDPTIVGD